MIRKIGLTGSTGSLGRIILKNKKKKLFYRFKGDIRNRKKIFYWIKKNKLDAVIHLAAIVPIKEVNKNKRLAKEVNFIGTKNIVDACVKRNIKWFFFSSTSHVYQPSKNKIFENAKKNPISYYGKTKLLAENYIKKKLSNKITKYCIGRIFSTTNINQRENYLVPDLKRKIKYSKKKIILKNLNHYRDFISMKDISKIIIKLMKIKFNGVINIAGGNKVFLKDIATIILKKYKKKNFIFKDSKNKTSLIGNITKLKKICKYEPKNKLEDLIFNE